MINLELLGIRLFSAVFKKNFSVVHIGSRELLMDPICLTHHIKLLSPCLASSYLIRSHLTSHHSSNFTPDPLPHSLTFVSPSGAAVAQWLRRSPRNPRSLTAVGSSPGRTTCGKGFFLAVGPYWLARCQYNVTEWHAVLICDIVCQWTSTIKVAISAH